jgi:hypothetical protein
MTRFLVYLVLVITVCAIGSQIADSVHTHVIKHGLTTHARIDKSYHY